MPRTTELIAEETAPVSSPLRRSSRIVAVSLPPAEASKPIKGKQENNDEEKVEAKPNRGRRASSVVKEDTQQKSEPAKTRSRRSSATTEPKEEEAKRQPVGRRRRSSATEEAEKGKTTEEETAKRPLRGRRSSVHEEKGQEEETNTRTTRSTRSVSRDVSLEPEEKKPATRGRRKSVEVQETETVEKKPVRTRRSSTDKLDGEPEGKVAKTAPSKPKRRLSITENAVNLAPIEEQEGERKSLSPVANKSAEAIQLTPIKKKQESAKTELDLSIINELSFGEENDVAEDKTVPETPVIVVEDSKDGSIEEASVEQAPENKITTPKKSPRFRQSKSPKEQGISPEPAEENKDASPTVKDSTTPEKSPRISEPKKTNLEEATVEKAEEGTGKLAAVSPSTPRKSPRITRTPTDVNESKAAETPVGKSEELEIVAGEITTARKSPRIQAKTKSVSPEKSAKNSTSQEESKEEDDSVFTSESPISTEADIKGSTYISTGSDDSFRIHLSDGRLQSNQDEESAEDPLNTSRTSDGSDKENSAINVDENLIQTKISKTPKKEMMKTLIERKPSVFEQSVVVARVSNVFRPKNVDYSFVEPMDVDNTVIDLDTTNIDKTANESKLIAGIPDESVDESFSLQLDVTKVESPSKSTKQPELENPEKPEIVEAVENLKTSLKESKAVPEIVIEIEKLDAAAILDIAPNVPSVKPVQEKSEVLDDSIDVVEIPSEKLEIVGQEIDAAEKLDASTKLDQEKPIKVSDESIEEAVTNTDQSTNSGAAEKLDASNILDQEKAIKVSDESIEEAVTNTDQSTNSRAAEKLDASNILDQEKSIEEAVTNTDQSKNSRAAEKLDASTILDQEKAIKVSDESIEEAVTNTDQSTNSRAAEKLDASTKLDQEKPIEVSDESINEAVIKNDSTNSRVAEISVIIEEPGNTTQALEASKSDANESYNVGVSNKIDMSQDYEFALPSDDDNEEMETTNLLDTSKVNGPADEPVFEDSKQLDESHSTGEANETLDIREEYHAEDTSKAEENTGKVEVGNDHETAQQSDDEKLDEPSDKTSDSSVSEEKQEESDESHQESEQEINPTIAEADSTKEVLEKSVATSISEEEAEQLTLAVHENITVKIPLLISPLNPSPLNLGSETSVEHNAEQDGDKIEILTSEDEENISKKNESAASNDLEDMEKSFQDVLNEDDSFSDEKKVESEVNGCMTSCEENKDQSERDITSPKPVPELTNEVNDDATTERTSDSDSIDELPVCKTLKKRVKLRKLDESNSDTKSTKSPKKIEKPEVDDPDKEADKPGKKSFDIYEFFKKSEESDTSSPEPKEKVKKSTPPTKKRKPKTKRPELFEEVSKTTLTPKRAKPEKLADSELGEYISKKLAELQSRPETNKRGGKEPSSESSDEELVEEESESEGNVFLDDMAEEGEEDTPSEGSNDIVDEGESIHTESDRETEDDYDSQDSFICDNDEVKLLSGDEYDLEDMKHEKKKKRSRIINVDDIDSDVITIERKEKPAKPKKRSRIITVSSSSEEEAEEPQTIEIKDELVPSTSQLMSIQGSSKRKSSITIIENINVQDIKDAALTERIHNLVDNFCTTIPKQGDISMNLSLEYARKSSSEDSLYDGKQKSPKAVEAIGKSKRPSNTFEQEISTKKRRLLSTSLDNAENVPKEKTIKRKLSQSLEEIETKKHKKKAKKPKKVKKESPLRQKRLPLSEGDLQTQTFSLMNQLITDVKARPKRTIKPTTCKPDLGQSWVIDNVGVMKPSTSIVSRKEIENFKKSKRHPKDFRNEMLYDSSRVKRVDTKMLLKKKGAYL